MNPVIYALREKPRHVGTILGMDIYVSPDMPRDTIKVFDGKGNCVAMLKIVDAPKPPRGARL